MKQRKIGLLALLAALVFAGLAFAQTPAEAQYQPPTDGRPPGTPGLPFTGFQVAMLLLAGAATTTAGFALRTTARGELAPADPSAENAVLEALELAPFARCAICSTSFNPRGYTVVVPRVGVFDSVACADDARAAHTRSALEPTRLLAVSAPAGTLG